MTRARGSGRTTEAPGFGPRHDVPAAQDANRHSIGKRRSGVRMLHSVEHENGTVPAPMRLTYPFTGRWLTQNSPASRLPSHGTTRFATAHAIDFVPVDNQGSSAPFTVRSLLRAEPAGKFAGFGRSIFAPIDGTVRAAVDSEADHDAVRGFPSVGYALSQHKRLTAGWLTLAGNHLMIETDDGPVVVLCHLKQGSISVALGQRVHVGDMLGRCGNSGNSTQPHLHLQVIDQPQVHLAQAVPFVLEGALPHNGEIVTVS